MQAESSVQKGDQHVDAAPLPPSPPERKLSRSINPDLGLRPRPQRPPARPLACPPGPRRVVGFFRRRGERRRGRAGQSDALTTLRSSKETCNSGLETARHKESSERTLAHTTFTYQPHTLFPSNCKKSTRPHRISPRREPHYSTTRVPSDLLISIVAHNFITPRTALRFIGRVSLATRHTHFASLLQLFCPIWPRLPPLLPQSHLSRLQPLKLRSTPPSKKMAKPPPTRRAAPTLQQQPMQMIP